MPITERNIKVDRATNSSARTIRLRMMRFIQSRPEVKPNITNTKFLCASISSDTHGGHLHSRSVVLYRMVKRMSVKIKQITVTQNSHSINNAHA